LDAEEPVHPLISEHDSPSRLMDDAVGQAVQQAPGFGGHHLARRAAEVKPDEQAENGRHRGQRQVGDERSRDRGGGKESEDDVPGGFSDARSISQCASPHSTRLTL